MIPPASAGAATMEPSVWSNRSNHIAPPGASGVGPVVTFTTGRSMSKLMKSGTSPGRFSRERSRI